MNDWVGQFEANILSRRLLVKGESLLVAVSGGLDSMVLLHLLSRLAPKHGWQLRVVHFNHRLRGRSSDADERLVCKTAEKLRLPVSVGQGNVREFAESNKLSIEMGARQLRHEFFARTAKEDKLKKIALAHHADDQVELFFLRLQRGSGSEGLRGMGWSAPSPLSGSLKLIRPLLGERKEALVLYAQENKVAYREDASNASIRFLRNRIRAEVVPVLKRQEPPIFETVLRTMEIIGAEGEFVAEAARKWRDQREVPFNDLHLALQRRILHDELRELDSPVDFELIERLRMSPGESFSISQGKTVFRDDSGSVHCAGPSQHDFQDASCQITLGKGGKRAFGTLLFQWDTQKYSPSVLPQVSDTEFFDSDKVGDRIQLRYWQPGDRFQPIGMRNDVKLQDCFVNLKISALERRKKVVAVAENGEIFWVEGMRISERFKLTPNTGRKLKWHWKST